MKAPLTQDRTVTSTKTAIFQLRQPSSRKRAMLHDAMTRTHHATAAFMADIARIEGLPGKTDRMAFMGKMAYATLRGWTRPRAGAAAARVDGMAMIESYIQRKTRSAATPPPTIQPITRRQDAMRRR
jgi:hypothetical protein